MLMAIYLWSTFFYQIAIYNLCVVCKKRGCIMLLTLNTRIVFWFVQFLIIFLTLHCG